MLSSCKGYIIPSGLSSVGKAGVVVSHERIHVIPFLHIYCP